MKWLDRLLGRTAAPPAPSAEVRQLPRKAADRLSAPPDPKGAPGTRIYHEYFADREPINGAHHWHARVYTPGGGVHESRGSASSHRAACQAAIAWADGMKKSLRGA